MEEAHHHVEPSDTFGKIAGLQTALLAVILTVFSIFAHRAHTDTILLANKSANIWSQYQAKRIRAYQVEMNTGLVNLLAPNSIEATSTIQNYTQQAKRYDKELEEISAEAKATQKEGDEAHHKTGYFDLAHGIIEIAIVLTSLYFLSRKRFFPFLGLAAAAIGTAIGLLGLFVH